MMRLIYSELFAQEAATRGFDLDAARDLSKGLEGFGVKSEVVDTEDWSEDQLTKAYFEGSCLPCSISRRYDGFSNPGGTPRSYLGGKSRP